MEFIQMKSEIKWIELLHLGSNLWHEEGNTKAREHRSTPCASPEFLFNRECWNKHTEDLKKAGVDTLMIDIAEALKYESHPEINVRNSWDHDTMKAEIKRLRDMGFELIPKLNFSACHDVWLGDYSRMLSTPIYYQVCKDLIDEVCSLFNPTHFHLGMDEETAQNQRYLYFCAIRQGDLWWHDLQYLVDCVERNNARAWIWSDMAWADTETFYKKMPKSVVQCNWYYSNIFDGPEMSEKLQLRLDMFKQMGELGYTQVPTGSVYSKHDNFEGLTKYCIENINHNSLYGMMQTSWERIDPNWMHVHDECIETLTAARNWYLKR